MGTTTPAAPPGAQPESRAPVRGGAARGLVRATRPRQWVKNLLVFAAPAAGGALDDGRTLLLACLTFVAFVLVSAATYLLNDVADAEADRRHPVKRDRPIAAGIVSVRAGLAAVVVCLAAGLGLAYAISWRLGLLLTAYKLVTLAYTFRFKHTPTVDIVVVASGFAVRAAAGGVATGIVLSDWFLAVTSFGSLFLVAGKRHGELVSGADAGMRPALAYYTIEHLRFVVTTTAAVTIMSYCLWAFEHPQTSEIPWWGLSIVPFVVGIMRYGLLVDRGEGATPEDIFIRDRGMHLVGAVWLALFLGSVYL